MGSILYQLIRPWSYLLIEHKSKYIYDYVVPGVLGVFTAIPILWLYWLGSIDLFSKAGLFKDLIGFLATLPGFFIAALAAIATFQKNDIDELMPVPAPLLSIRLPSGHDIDIQLTRRRFLCSLFAFLTAQTILLCVIAYTGIHMAPAIATAIGSVTATKSVGSAAVLLFLFSFWQLLSSTFLGLYYLGDRLHHPKS